MSVLVAVASPFGGRLSDALRAAAADARGAAMSLVGSLALLAVLQSDTPASLLAACLALLRRRAGAGHRAGDFRGARGGAGRLSPGTASGTSSMMRYTGSIIGAGLLAGVLSNGSSATGEVMTFRIVTVAMVATAGLACVAALFVHRFAEREPVRVVVPPLERDRARACGPAEAAEGEPRA